MKIHPKIYFRQWINNDTATETIINRSTLELLMNPFPIASKEDNYKAKQIINTHRVLNKVLARDRQTAEQERAMALVRTDAIMAGNLNLFLATRISARMTFYGKLVDQIRMKKKTETGLESSMRKFTL